MWEYLFLVLLLILILVFVFRVVIINKKYEKMINNMQSDTQYDKINDFEFHDELLQNSIDADECSEVIASLMNFDFKDADYCLKKLLITHPNNMLAQTLCDIDFHFDIRFGGEIEFVEFDLLPIEIYLEEYASKLDYTTLMCFLCLIAFKYDLNEHTINCFRKCLLQFKYLFGEKSDYIKNLCNVMTLIIQNKSEKQIEKLLKQTRNAGMKTFILTDNEYLAAGMDSLRDDLKYYKKELKNNKEKLMEVLINYIKSLNFLTKEEKNIVINKIKVMNYFRTEK